MRPATSTRAPRGSARTGIFSSTSLARCADDGKVDVGIILDGDAASVEGNDGEAEVLCDARAHDREIGGKSGPGPSGALEGLREHELQDRALARAGDSTLRSL